jgi:hypothetical protein
MHDSDDLLDEPRLFDIPTPVVPPSTSLDAITQVFEFWVATFRSTTKGPKPVLSDKRRSKIQRALNDYDLKTCFDAITGCAMSDWHMGDNPRGKRYDDIELILRDSAHIERFATICAEGGNSARAEFLAEAE